MATSTAGYSGTPLARKLGLREGSRVVVFDAPPGYAQWLAPIPAGVRFDADVSDGTDVVHVFCDPRAALKTRLDALRPAIAPAAAVWVSRPKKASKVATDVNRGRDSRARAADRLRRRQGVRGERGLVGPETGDPQGIARLKAPAAARLLRGCRREQASSGSGHCGAARCRATFALVPTTGWRRP